MTVEITNLEATAEVEKLMERFNLSAKDVIETVLIEAGHWMPMETLGNSAQRKVMRCRAEEKTLRSIPRSENDQHLARS